MMQHPVSKVAILHYSAPPIIGGVESVILAHARLFNEAGYPVTVLAGRGRQDAFPDGVRFIEVPALDSQHPQISKISSGLEQGYIPTNFEKMATQIMKELSPRLDSFDHLIVHNVFTKHFNLPLTTALFRLLDERVISGCIAWCHDFTWTSPRSRLKVHPGYPWDFLRTFRSDVVYVTISQQRQRELAGLLGCTPKQIHVVYNGVNSKELLALSEVGANLIDQLGLQDAAFNLLLPVRVTQAKNIELALHVVEALKVRGICPRLIITGPPDPHDPKSNDYFQSLLALRERLGVVQDVRFVYELGLSSGEPFLMDMPVVAELFRATDALFMPSNREGFGMPVLEAGLLGIPVFCSDHVPAAREIGGQDIVRFSPEADPNEVADLIMKYIEGSPVLRFRRRVRQRLTWQSIFQRKILPLLAEGAS